MFHSFDASLPPDMHADDAIVDPLDLSIDESEIVAAQEAAAALAYSAPVAPLNPDLKKRLFDNLGLTMPEPDIPEPDILDLLNLSIQELKDKAASLPWSPMIDAPGFDMAIWQEQEMTRTLACFIRADQPGSFPAHYHPAEEILIVLAGDLVEAGRHYSVGDRLQSAANTSHQLDTTQGCLLFCIASMDNQFA